MKKILLILLFGITATTYLHSAGLTFGAERELYNNYFIQGGGMRIPHHTYSSMEPIFENYLLCMDAYTASISNGYMGNSQFVVSLVDKETLNKIYGIQFNWVNRAGIFLTDKYWKNDTTLRCVFTNLLWMNTGTTYELRGGPNRRIMFIDLVIKQNSNEVVIYPIELAPNDELGPYIDELPTKLGPSIPEDMPFYVKELDEFRSIRFGFGQHFTLRINYNKDEMWYDTIFHDFVDTSDYPSNTIDLKENDTMRFVYKNVSYNMYPGIGNYHRTADGNIIVLKAVSSEAIDTSASEKRSVLIGYQLFIFNSFGELLSDKFISTFETKSLFHTVLLKDDGFYCTARGGTLPQQFREYTLEGEMVNQIMLGNVPTTHRIQIADNAVCFFGSGTTDGTAKTSYKSVSKYSLDGTFLARFNWNYNGNQSHTTDGHIYSIYADKSTIYYNGEHISDAPYAIVGKLYDATSIIEPSALSYSKLYPNPTTSNSTITLELAESAQVNITLCDILGREIKQIYNAFTDAGTFTHSFATQDLPKGIYYLKILSGGEVMVEKVVVN
jgi:hypothetical protein